MEYNILRDWLSNHQFTWEKLGDILTYHHNAPILFSSGLFFFLFIGFLMIYMSLRKHTLARIIYVTLFSLYFYYKSSGLWFGLLVFTATSDFLIAQCISHTTSVLKRKLFVTLSLCINLGMLGYFKYFNFLGELFTMAAGGEWLKMNIFLPVGISFFTFQSISYVIDVYRGRIQPLGRWIDYVFYVSFFPQLVAGPIVRARDFIPQMYKNPTVTRSEFGEGLFLILCGLFKKTVISDYISMNFVDRIFDAPLLYTGVENLLGVYGYALQIYCDFSGYSDMAIGLGRIFGFHFLENFNYPFISRNVAEFWRRWHISLGSWFRDYVYIPLGGNRVPVLRWMFNILVVWFLTGFWHGADWTFIVWGLYFAVFLVLEKFVLNKFFAKLPRFFSHIYVTIAILISFVIFHGVGMSGAISDLGSMFGAANLPFWSSETTYNLLSYIFVLIIAIVGATPLVKNAILKLKEKANICRVINVLEPVFHVAVLLITTAYFVDGSFSPFLYFRF